MALKNHPFFNGLLGGIRSVSLNLANDYKQFFDRIITNGSQNPNEEFKPKLFPKIGLTTYLLQAKYVAYVNESDVSSQISASLDLHLKELGHLQTFLADMDEIKLSTYSAINSELVNNGLVGQITWTNQPLNFADTNLDCEMNGETLANSDGGWHTVFAVFTRAPQIYREWIKDMQCSPRKPVKCK